MIELYTASTPNGWKASVMLEEIGMPYQVHAIDLATGDQKKPDFLAINPNGRIPALVDREAVDKDAGDVVIFESGAIMLYLAEKSGKLLPAEPARRYQAISWLMFQMGGLGPMFGQMGFFVKFAGSEIEDPRPRERYVSEAKRLLAVLEKELADKDWIAGDYSIADIAIAPWLAALDFYQAKDLVGWDELPNVNAYLERFLARPAVQKGRTIPNPQG